MSNNSAVKAPISAKAKSVPREKSYVDRPLNPAKPKENLVRKNQPKQVGISEKKFKGQSEMINREENSISGPSDADEIKSISSESKECSSSQSLATEADIKPLVGMPLVPPLRVNNANSLESWDSSLYPVLKKHNNRRFPQLTYHIPVSRSYTVSKAQLVSQFHPCDFTALKTYNTDNRHPYCAALRAVAEAWSLQEVIRELKGTDTKDTYIMDVGGAVKRHASHNRSFVWSCIPGTDVRNLIRTFELPPGRYCKHQWSECDCVNVSASISVHAIYYCTEEEILIQLLKQKRAIHYAVVHLYNDDEGSMMNGELTYVKRGGLIKVKALGNLTHYVHRTTDWMNTGHYSSSSGTLEWDIAREFDDVIVLRFVATSITLPPPLDLPPEFEPIPIINELEDPIVKFAKIVNESINYGAAMDERNYKQFLARVRRKGIEFDLDHQALITYASDRWISQKTVLQKPTVNMVKRAESRFERLNLLVHSHDITHLVLAVCAIVLAWNISLHGLVWSSNEGLFHNMVNNGHFVNFIFVGLMLAVLISSSKDKWLPLLVRKRTILPTYSTSIVKLVGAMVDDYCCTMPHRELDPTKVISIKQPTDYGESCEPKPAAKAMVFHSDFAPYFPRKCPHNVYSCLCDKLLYKIEGAGKYKFPLHPILVKVAGQIRGNLVPLSFEEYVVRFPNAKQDRLRREELFNRGEHIFRWNDSQVFTKFEAYAQPKYPRPIISASVEFNYSIGRWLVPLSELFEESLPSNIMFPLHGDAEAIGQFHDDYKHHVLYDADFTAFDSSQRNEVLSMIIDFLRLCGVPEVVLKREALDMHLILVTNRNGLKAKIKSIRCSGRSATLLGNSLVTINTSLHIFKQFIALLVKGDDSVIYNKVEVPDIQLVVAEYLSNGLVVKLRRVNNFEVEFCSSIFMPTEQGSVLTGKPGKLLAKTLWCKNLHYSELQMQQQFASILKGLRQTVSLVYGLNQILEHPVYKRWFPQVEAYRSEYNEYTDSDFVMNEESIEFICLRYGLDLSDLDELGKEIKTGFPIRLESFAATKMIEKDWGPCNDGSHLKMSYSTNYVHYMVEISSPILEELARSYFPIYVTLFLGIVETLYYRDLRHLLWHVIYLCCSLYSPFLALLVHMLVNMAGPKTNILKTIMPKKGNNKPKGPKPKKRGKKRNNNVPRSSPLARIAMMVANPCESELVQGLYGVEEGILSRYKSSHTPAEVTTSGYFIWAPSYVGTTYGVGDTMNCFYFSDASPNTQPINTVISPLGSSIISTIAVQSGASNFVFSGTAQDFRTVSACMRVVYTGNTSNCAGRVAALTNIPAKLLIDARPSVNSLFSLAKNTERTSLDVMEVTYRPEDETQHFRNFATTLFSAGAGAFTGMSNFANNEVPTMMGFAWTGVPANQFTFEFIQNIEWRPRATFGYVENPVKQMSAQPMAGAATKWLDDYIPHWQTRVFDVGSRIAGNLVNQVLGGPNQRTMTGTQSSRLRIQY